MEKLEKLERYGNEKIGEENNFCGGRTLSEKIGKELVEWILKNVGKRRKSRNERIKKGGNFLTVDRIWKISEK